VRQFTQTSLGSHFGSFESFGRIGRAVNEASSGVGLGVVLVALAAWWGARRASRANGSPPAQRWLRLAPWGLLLLFMAKVGTYQNARQLAPYYVFLFPSLLVMAGQAQLVRRRWWQRLGLAVMLSAVALLLVSRDRPLLPCQTIARRLHTSYPQSGFLALVHEAYMIRSTSGILRRPFSADLPPGAGVVGYATFHGSCEPGLWAPFGIRRVQRVLKDDSPAETRSRGIRYLVLDEDDGLLRAKPLEQWLTDFDAEMVKDITYLPAPRSSSNRLYLIRLKPEGHTGQAAGESANPVGGASDSK
jgi:hypothetical protein